MAALQALEVFLEMGFGLRWLFSRRYREQLRREENPVWATLQDLAVFEGVCVLALVAAIVLIGGVTLAVCGLRDWRLLWEYMQGMPRTNVVP